MITPDDVTDSPGMTPGPVAEISPPSRWRRIAGIALVILVAAAVAYEVYRDRHSFTDTIRRVGLWATLASFAAGTVGVASAYPLWREVLGGLGVRLDWRHGARVFFTSQLGKYLPGSVWPVVMQMEAGRARGASRRTMLAANLITIVLACTTGLLLACVLLPISDPHALAKYWWVLFALAPLLVLLHPRAMPALLDRVFGLLHRPALGERLAPAATMHAAGWSLVGWLGFGVHVWILYAAAGRVTFSGLLVCVGGMALAISVGILAIPVPAGAGPRELILVLVLKGGLGAGGALAVVLASRVLLVLADVALAGVGLALGRGSKLTGTATGSTGPRQSSEG
jgi:hypothetical protein